MDSLMQYDISDEEDEMDAEDSGTVLAGPSTAQLQPRASSSTATVVTNREIEDEEDRDSDENNFEMDGNEPAASTSSSGLKLDTFLPMPKTKAHGTINDVISDDLSAIPPKKVYGDEEKPQTRSSPFANLTTKKTASGVVQISIPSLKTFSEEDTDNHKKKIFQGSQKASGLFALLPQPKNDVSFQLGSKKPTPKSADTETVPAKTSTTHFVPQAVKQASATKRPASLDQRLEKVKAKYLKQEFNVRVVSKSATTATAAVATISKGADAEDSDEETNGSDFFSLDPTSDNFDVTTAKVPTDFEFKSKITINQDVEDLDSNGIEPVSEPLPVPFETHSQPTMHQEDLMKYIQPNKKGKGKAAEINIIDVSADDLRPQSTDWLKTITDTSIIPPRKAVLPGGMMKRKHQITYLAAEAKAREEELQNQWASNRHARRQTQNKYGF